MIKGRRLTEEVSVSELMTMRESGMTNAQIAKSLDVSVGTVMRYIGKMPKEMLKRKKTNVITLAPVEQKKPEKGLAIFGLNFSMAGKVASFKADIESGNLEITGDNLVGAIPVSKISDLIHDLQMAMATTQAMAGYARGEH